MSTQIIEALDVMASNFDSKFREHADEILQLKQARNAPLGDSISSPSLGSQVADTFAKDAELFGKTQKLRFEVKAAGDPITTAVAGRVAAGSMSVPTGAALGIQNAIPTREAIGTTSLVYSRYQSIEGAAAVQAGEGTAKAAVRPVFAEVTQQSITIAGYTKVSKQALSDRAELTKAIDVTLRRSIATAYDAMWTGGSVTPAFTGLIPLATAYTSLAHNQLVDATSEGISMMQTAGFEPNVVVFTPADWLSILVARDAQGKYLAGDYLAALPENLRGFRVVLSPTVTAGKSLILDTAHIEGLIVSDFSVEIGYVNDDFTKNLATILGEFRVIPTFRSVGAARLITKAV